MNQHNGNGTLFIVALFIIGIILWGITNMIAIDYVSVVQTIVTGG